MSIEAMKQALEAFEHMCMHTSAKVGYKNQLIGNAMDTLRQAIEQAEKQEPVSWVDLLKEASQIVRDKVVWKRFIDGTPLANDIACWMADFAIQHAQPPQREWVGFIEVTICPKTMRPCEVTGCLGCENHPDKSRSICSGRGITE